MYKGVEIMGNTGLLGVFPAGSNRGFAGLQAINLVK
jgi:hypothetical protein